MFILRNAGSKLWKNHIEIISRHLKIIFYFVFAHKSSIYQNSTGYAFSRNSFVILTSQFHGDPNRRKPSTFSGTDKRIFSGSKASRNIRETT